MTALGALAGAAACILVPVFDASEAAHLIERRGITHVVGADAMFDAMLQVPGVNFSTLRHGVQADFVGLTLPVTERADALQCRFTGTYGSSECFSLMAFHPWQAPAAQRAKAGGVPIDPLISVRVVDPESGHLLGEGQAGELQIRGPNVLAGYLNNPQATAKAFTEDGWFRSGDLAQMEGAGFIYLARMGDSLRLRGFLVNPAEIESSLMQHAQVQGAQVVGVNMPGEGDVAVAYVLCDTSATESQLLAYCRDRMAAYKVPRRIIAIDAFPAINGPNGNKIQKRVLREMARTALGL
jgi:fatty-acyl-CoA synthase